jgi:hypothetical protein
MNGRAAVLALAIAAVPVHVGGGEAGRSFDALFQVHGDRYGVDWRLLRAVAEVESHLNPRAVNRRDPSFGLMQVYCRSGADGVCRNRLDLPEWAGMTRARLMEPETNVRIGAAILASNIRAYGPRRGIACYNAWSVCRDRQKEPFSNAYYLDRVVLTYRRLIADAESSFTLQCQPLLGVAMQGVAWRGEAKPGKALQAKGCLRAPDRTPKRREGEIRRSTGREMLPSQPPHDDRAVLGHVTAR